MFSAAHHIDFGFSLPSPFVDLQFFAIAVDEGEIDKAEGKERYRYIGRRVESGNCGRRQRGDSLCRLCDDAPPRVPVSFFQMLTFKKMPVIRLFFEHTYYPIGGTGANILEFLEVARMRE